MSKEQMFCECIGADNGCTYCYGKKCKKCGLPLELIFNNHLKYFNAGEKKGIKQGRQDREDEIIKIINEIDTKTNIIGALFLGVKNSKRVMLSKLCEEVKHKIKEDKRE